MEHFPVQKKGSHECSNSRKESNDFLFIVPRRRYLTAISQPPLPSLFSFPFFFFFPLPSLSSRKRDKHERAGIDLSEALHEHQQRSRNKSKRLVDPPKRTSPSRYRLSLLLPPRSSPNLSVFSDPWLFSKEPPYGVYVGGPRLSTLPSCHFAYIQTHAIHRPLFVPSSFQYSFLCPLLLSLPTIILFHIIRSSRDEQFSFIFNFLNLICVKTKNRSVSTIPSYELIVP